MTTACTGHTYPINPDAPEEGTDIHHDQPCPAHPPTVAAQVAPATTWALARLRSTSPRGSNVLGAVTGRAVLLILANLADEALNGRTGYVGTTAEQVATIIGLAPSTVTRWLKALVYGGVIVTADVVVTSAKRFRIPEEAFNR